MTRLFPEAAPALRFHARNAWFNVREQFSDLSSGVAGFLIFPFFIWLLSHLWNRFNSPFSSYNRIQVLEYVGITEILFLTFLRATTFTRATGDFSLGLARPRSWLAFSFSGIFGRALGGRLIYLGIFILVLPPLGADWGGVVTAALRLLLLLPLLGVVQGLVALLFASSKILWDQTSYFTLPVSKVFLVLGGVFAPLADYAEPWRRILLALPPSDLFFQPASFCVTGSFHGMSPAQWVGRIGVQIAVLWVLNQAFHRHARKNHRGHGG